MSILRGNCQRVGIPRAIQALSSLIKFVKPFIIFLSDTKCLKNKMDSIRISIGF